MGKKDQVKKAVQNAIGDGVNSVVECIDVDGIVRRIDVENLLDRVDFNAILDEIDVDRHLDRVDLNRLLARVDFDAIVQRLDVPAIVGKSDVGSIMVQSTTGIFTHVLDSLRTQVIIIDLFLLRIKQMKRWRDTKGALPLAPGDPEELEYDECPESRAEKAVAVQGRYAGIFSKGVAIMFDCACLTLSFAVIVIVVQLYWVLFVGDVRGDIREKVNKELVFAVVSRQHLWTFILYCIYWFFYFFLSTVLTGRTLGLGLAGLKLVDSQTGLKLSGSQAFIRTLLLPITVTFVPFLMVIGFVRRDERMLHDVVAGTGTVYRWNARMAGLREKAERAEEEADVQRLLRAHRVSIQFTSCVPAIETRFSGDSTKKIQ